MSRRQKAAVIVRLLLEQGAEVPLSGLSDEQQVALTEAMADLRTVDRQTLREVVEEFADALDAVGLTFPGGFEGAFGVLEGHLSEATASRLRRKAVLDGRGDPWPRILGLPPKRLLPLIQAESVEVAAVILSKLPVQTAADLLGELPGERARRLARAISETASVQPETVRRIGLALMQEIEAEAVPAFEAPPVQRVGAILNHAAAAMRDAVLDGLESEDAEFAAALRRAILTFRDLPRRLESRDVPKVLREVAPDDLAAAVAAAIAAGGADAATAEYLLGAISQRMAGQLRETAAERGAPAKPAEADAAMASVVTAVRALESRGEVVLRPAED